MFNCPKNSTLITKIGWFSCLFGLSCILLTTVIFIANYLYEIISPPTDMYLFGLITTIMMFYIAPIGGMVLSLGGAIYIVGWILKRKGGEH